uniref:Uncharacterized protein n=1 Tax=Candidatus Kentrum sp. FW TaxID=2126338 RepID=A0A450SNC6_9GAMM|nr:MAG: hypothetical protein BECKFW1821A_GA0114235_105321 [Candidatus Kentron sp. FW]
MKLGYQRAGLDEENCRLESRVRENRTHGSEGGAGKLVPTPITKRARLFAHPSLRAPDDDQPIVITRRRPSPIRGKRNGHD